MVVGNSTMNRPAEFRVMFNVLSRTPSSGSGTTFPSVISRNASRDATRFDRTTSRSTLSCGVIGSPFSAIAITKRIVALSRTVKLCCVSPMEICVTGADAAYVPCGSMRAPRHMSTQETTSGLSRCMRARVRKANKSWAQNPGSHRARGLLHWRYRC